MSDRDRSGYDVEAIKAAHPLDVFLSARGVVLKRHGAVLQGKCPFHNEVNGTALTVWPDEGRWRCFGKCDAGGDVIEAVMRLDGVSFKEACARLAGGDDHPASQGNRAGLARWQAGLSLRARAEGALEGWRRRAALRVDLRQQ